MAPRACVSFVFRMPRRGRGSSRSQLRARIFDVTWHDRVRWYALKHGIVFEPAARGGQVAVFCVPGMQFDNTVVVAKLELFPRSVRLSLGHAGPRDPNWYTAAVDAPGQYAVQRHILEVMLSYDGPAVHAGKVAVTIVGASTFTMSGSRSEFTQTRRDFVGTRDELEAEMGHMRYQKAADR